MTPVPDAGFELRCRALCPRFRALDTLPARKSQLLAGEIDGAPVVAKRLARPNAVWAWYLAREIAIYRAFTTSPPPVRVPKLHAADDEVLVIERLPGAPLATRRSPEAVLDAATLAALITTHDRFATWRGTIAHDPPPPAVRSQLRARYLEDPTAPVAWVRDGVTRAARRKVLPDDVAAQIVSAISAHEVVVPSHGDLLLRNAIGTAPGQVVLVDWECAGLHLADWDLALLWTQLAADHRPVIEAVVLPHPARAAVFFGLVAFALAREISFLHAFRADPRHATLSRIQRELDAVCRRLRAS